MNLNESELEQQLRLLRPRPARTELEGKIAAALSQPELLLAERTPTAAILRRARPVAAPWAQWLRGLGWAFAGAAAAVAAITLLDHSESGNSGARIAAVAAPAAAFEPTESTEELVTAEDEGLVLDSDQTPVRQVRYHSLERHVWVNPQTGARMEFEIPREDVRFISVAMQ
jgi:hypothetical protein